MKKLLIMLMLLFTLSATFAQSGHYKGGKGSSHKGGKYKNPSTGDHYRKHKKG